MMVVVFNVKSSLSNSCVFCVLSVIFCLLTKRQASGLTNIVTSNPDHVRFYLYDDPENSEIWDGKELNPHDMTSMVTAGLKMNIPVKFLIHGFNHDYSCWFPQEVKDVYMRNGFHSNLIAVDWGPLATPNASEPLATLSYPLSVRNVRIVGKKLSDFISVLRELRLIKLSTIHMIGFSLGAHIAGHAGNDLHRKYQQKIGRITGLDPAGPLFYSGFLGRRLRKSDARFVDVVHTDMAEYGIVGSIAHMDFYVNGGGPRQPGCAAGNASCSHSAAARFYLQSIGTDHYRGCRCASYYAFNSGSCKCQTSAIFGDRTQPGPIGSYYLKMQLEPLSGKYKC